MRILACVLILALLAFGSLAAAEPKGAGSDLQALAKKFVEQLAAGDFKTAVKGFDRTMSAALPADKLGETWKAINAQAGPFQGQTGVRETVEQGYHIVFVACRFEKTALEAKIVFDSRKQIAGLFFVPPPPAPASALPDYARPGAYREAAVRVGRGDDALPGTLSSPVAGGPHPGIVLLHGSGPADRDETIGPNRPFRDLAAGLASRGVCVLRYDKRSLVHPAALRALGDRLTLHEEAVADAVEAVRLLRRSPGVDPARVLLLGHSLGGAVVPRVAALEPGLAGCILVATPSRPLQEVYAQQVEYLASLDGVVSDEERAGIETVRRQVARVDGTAPADPGPLPLGMSRAYWDDLSRHDARQAAAALDGPVLVIQGGRDYQVTAADLDGWRRLLAGRSDVSFRIYPALNHLLMCGAGPGKPQEYDIPGHVAAEVIEDIATWIRNVPAAAPRRG